MRKRCAGILIAGLFACAAPSTTDEEVVGVSLAHPRDPQVGRPSPDDPPSPEVDADFDGVPDAEQTNASGIDGPPIEHVSFGAAVGRELYLLGSNLTGAHWDGARWHPLSQPSADEWRQFVASPGALWGIAQFELEVGPRPLPELWRRDRITGAWESFPLPFHARSMWAADDEHLWITDGGQIALFDGTRLSEPFVPGGEITTLTGTAWSDGWMVAGGTLWHHDGVEWAPSPVQPCGGDRVGFVVPHPDSPWVQCTDPTWTRLEKWDGRAWNTHLKPVDPAVFVPSTELGEWQSTLRSVRRADGSGLHRVVAGYVGRIPTRAYGASFWHVSSKGVAAEWDGSRWIERGRTRPVVLADTTSGDSLWLAGENGFVARRRQGVWRRMDTDQDESLTAIAAYGEHVWAAGHGVGLERGPGRGWRPLLLAYWVGPQVWMAKDAPVGWVTTIHLAYRRSLGSERGSYRPLPDRLLQVSGDDESNLWAAIVNGFQRWDPASRTWRHELSVTGAHALSARDGEVWGLVEEGLVRRSWTGQWTSIAWDGASPAQILLRSADDAWIRDVDGAVWRHDGLARTQVRASGCDRLIEGPDGMECLTPQGLEPAEER